MNKNKKTSKGTIALIIFLLMSALTAWGIVLGLHFESKYSVEESSIKNNVAEISSFDLPKYNKIDIEEYPLANWKRYVVRVIADEVTKENLIDISEKIVEEVKNDKGRFHALAIHYYTDKTSLNQTANLGVFTYAPDGDWSKAEDALSDFSNFKSNYTELVEKNWDEKPTAKELEMYELYDKYEYVDDGIKAVSEKYNIESEEARECMSKLHRWIYK